MSEIDSVHGLPRYSISLTNDIQQVLHDIGKQRIGNEIMKNTEQRYSHAVIQRVK